MNGAAYQWVRVGRRVIHQATVGGPERMRRGTFHEHPLGLETWLFSIATGKHARQLAWPRRLERHPPPVGREARVRNRSFGTAQEIDLGSGVGVDHGDGVRPSEPLDD